jgi:hypothetical protein
MTKQQYKKTIDNFLSQRFTFLLECAGNILKSKISDPSDLIGELVLYLYDNQIKLQPYLDGTLPDLMSMKGTMLEGFSVSWMRLQAAHATTPFNRKHMLNSGTHQEDFNIESVEDMIDESIDFCEDDYIKDLRTIYSDCQVENILKIHTIYPNLSEVHKLLFNAYFMEGLSYDKIREKYTFFRTKNGKKVYYKSKKSIYNLMLELKNEIKKNI